MKKIAIKNAGQDMLQLFSIYFTPCDFVNNNVCESKEAIQTWLGNKTMLLVYNQ